MKKRDVWFFFLTVQILFLVFVSSPLAVDLEDVDMLGCPDGIVNIGDSKSDVLKKCGEPTRKVESPEFVWIYNFGSSNFVYYLTFSRERLERIQAGEYGK